MRDVSFRDQRSRRQRPAFWRSKYDPEPGLTCRCSPTITVEKREGPGPLAWLSSSLLLLAGAPCHRLSCNRKYFARYSPPPCPVRPSDADWRHRGAGDFFIFYFFYFLPIFLDFPHSLLPTTSRRDSKPNLLCSLGSQGSPPSRSSRAPMEKNLSGGRWCKPFLACAAVSFSIGGSLDDADARDVTGGPWMTGQGPGNIVA